jgi:protein phosphatase
MNSKIVREKIERLLMIKQNGKQPTNAGAGERAVRLEVAQRCHVGRQRSRNEDSLFTFVSQSGGDQPLPPVGLFIVADGMGGHSDGHRASKIASRTVAGYVLDKIYRPLLQPERNGPQEPVQEVLVDAVVQANRAIADPDPKKVMGTTLTAALVLANRLFLVHAGDSRAYLWQEGELQAVTTDHTLVQALQDAGHLTPAEAATHPERNVLYRALMGDNPDAEILEQVDIFTRTLPERGQLMLCSDGLWGLVPETEMSAILADSGSLQEKADQLLQAALQAGGHDNITVILVDFTL